MSLEELNTLLNEVLEQEDYIRAIAIGMKSTAGEVNNVLTRIHDRFSELQDQPWTSYNPEKI